MYTNAIAPLDTPVKAQEGAETRIQMPETNSEKELMAQFAEIHKSTNKELAVLIGFVALLICGFFVALKYT